jgi:hypothetical protein
MKLIKTAMGFYNIMIPGKIFVYFLNPRDIALYG